MASDPPEERARLHSRLAVLDGVLRAHGFGTRLINDIDAAADRSAALALLKEPPYSFELVVAHHVLDSPIAGRTRLAIAAVSEEAEQLRERLAT